MDACCMKFLFMIMLIQTCIVNLYGQKCYASQSAFTTDCTNTYNGFVNGGRCFFLAGSPTYPASTWTGNWPLCANQGGTLAHIHASNEWTAMVNYITNVFGNQSGINIEIALLRDPTLTNSSTGYAIDQQKTYWYDDSANFNPLLTAGNTWIYTHYKDDKFKIDNNCFTTWAWKGAVKIGDCNCSNNYRPLCTVYNLIQDFTLVSSTANGNCMNETVIKSFSLPCASDCALACSDNIWCRGFNFYKAAQRCDLFTWYYVDTTHFMTNVDCYHYAYVP